MRQFILATLVLSLAFGTAIGQQMELHWYSVDAGGVTRSNGGAFELSGTIGQVDAGTLSGDSLNLIGGFWFPVPLSDCNEDGAIDGFDHASFTECLTGPGEAVPPGCACFDVNQTGDIDLLDFATAQSSFTGS